MDPTSHVQQLVVTLRYADITAPGAPAAVPDEQAVSDDLAAAEEASLRMKGAVAHTISRIGPSLGRLGSRAQTMVALLAKRAIASREQGSVGRRTTALPPGGGLRASGRHVVRGDASSPPAGEILPPPTLRTNKSRAVVGGAVMAAAIIVALLMKKPQKEAAVAALPVAAASASAQAPEAAQSASAGVAAVAPAVPPPASDSVATSQSPGSPDATADEIAESQAAHKKHIRVTPFGNGPVHHGNVLRIKMDGPIESIEGASQAMGFTVKLPGRKSLEAAAPLAARDSRIAAIKVANENAGADLTLTFKDGVPNYQVSARGDTLVIALAPVGA
ncbi:MAG: hypothetical protein ACREJ3_06395, partial [Polyangiaceae bacterium]